VTVEQAHSAQLNVKPTPLHGIKCKISWETKSSYIILRVPAGSGPSSRLFQMDASGKRSAFIKPYPCHGGLRSYKHKIYILYIDRVTGKKLSVMKLQLSVP